MGHKHSKVGEVCAGAGCVSAVGAQQSAILSGPESCHGTFRVTPERAVWIEVLFRLLE